MHKIEKANWKRNTILFLISQCITLFGSTLVQMAVIWYVTLKTTSGIWVAAFSICSYLPQFLISFWGGVWADQYDRKRLIILSDGMIAIITLLTFFMVPFLQTEPIFLGTLLLMSIFRSLGAGIQTPAVNAMIPQLVPSEHLMSYNGFNAIMQSIVQFSAPAAAGVILATFPLRTTLLVDVGTAFVGIGLFFLVPLQKKEKGQEKRTVIEDLKSGIRYAYCDTLLRRLLLIYGLFVLLCVPGGFMAGLLVSRTYGDTYWYLTTVELVGFAGMTAGGFLMGTWKGFSNQIKTLVFGLLLFGSMSIGMGIAPTFLIYLLMMTLYGVALTVIQTTITTLIQQQTKAEMQGRVFGLMGSIYAGFLPLGMAVFGPAADTVPLQWSMVGAGIILILMAIWTMSHFRYRPKIKHSK